MLWPTIIFGSRQSPLKEHKMADLFIPKKEDTTITLHTEDKTIDVDITHIQEIIIKAYDEAETNNTNWQDHFVLYFQAEYGIRLSRTTMAVMIGKAQEMLEVLKKSCFEPPSSTSDTTSQSQKD